MMVCYTMVCYMAESKREAVWLYSYREASSANVLSELAAASSPEPPLRSQPATTGFQVSDTLSRLSSKAHWTSDPQICEMMNVCRFKLLSLWWLVRASIEN